MNGLLRYTTPIAAIWLAVVFGSAAAAQLTPERLLDGAVEKLGPEQANLATAIEKFSAGDQPAALEALRAAKQKNAALPPPETLLAQLAFAAGQTPLARGWLERATIAAPDDPGALVLLGTLALREGRFTEAGLCFQAAGRLCDRYRDNPLRKQQLEARAADGVVAVAEARGDWAEVSRLTSFALKSTPDDLRLLSRLARAQFHQGKREEAEATLKTAFQAAQRAKDPNMPRPEINLALLHEEQAARTADAVQRQELRAAARVLMAQAVKTDSGNIHTQLAVARWGLEGGDYAVARQCGEAALKLDANSFEARWYVGVAAPAQHDLATAETMFKAAYLQSPEDAQLVNQLALVLAAQADEAKRKQAVDLAQSNASRFAGKKDALARNVSVTLAWTLHRAGRDAEAEALLGPVVAAGGLSLDSLYLSAQFYFDRGRAAVARRILEPVIKSGATLLHREEAAQLWTKVQDSPTEDPRP